MKPRPQLTVLAALLVLGLTAPAGADVPAAVDDDASTHEARSAARPPARGADATHLARTEHPVGDPAVQELREAIKKVWGGRTLRRGTTAVYVIDARTGRRLYAVHEDEPLNPASNVKLIATAAALDALGPDWRYVTRVLGPTPDTEGVVRGSIYLAGNHDPTLRARHLQALAGALAEAGVTRIEGDVLIGDSPTRDAVGHHRVTVVVRGGDSVGEAPTIEMTPANSFVEIDMQAATTRTRRARIRASTELVEQDDQPIRYKVTVSGKMGVGHKRTYKRWVPRRNLYSAHILRTALIHEAGVEVTGDVRALDLDAYVAEARAASFLPVELGRHRSKPLGRIAATVNKRSINYMADRLVNTAGAVVYGGDPSMAKGIKLMHRWLEERAGIDPDAVVLDTGSGLSYKTQLTARQIARVLRVAGGYLEPTDAPEPEPRVAFAAEPDDPMLRRIAAASTRTTELPARKLLARTFRRSLAIAGKDGTLRRRFRRSEARGKVIGKTGTLTNIIALSGVITVNEQALIFAIVTNDHRRGWRGSVRREHEKFIDAMYDYLARPRD